MSQMQSKMRHYAGRKYGRALTRFEWSVIQGNCNFKNSALKQMSSEDMRKTVLRYNGGDEL